MRREPSHSETPEQWWIEVVPRGLFWDAVARSSQGRAAGMYTDGGGIRRVTERWAVAAAKRELRKRLRREARDAVREEQTRVYPVDL